MSDRVATNSIAELVEAIEIPASTYETAESRYKDLGSWFGRPESNCCNFEPHIYPQGSFRLGTVIRPLREDAPYDLDLSCKLQNGFSRKTYTQQQLKSMVGVDVENYRLAQRIQEPKESKHRCWRLEYADDIRFHMDIVPCVPEQPEQRKLIKESMMGAGSAEPLAEAVSNLTVSITDDRRANYRIVSEDWITSNPEGYARWFESRMNLATSLLGKRLREARDARVDDLPAFRWKTPLQRCVQVLKRHRDVMFVDNPELCPISIIITTLAANAYRGELELADAMQACLKGMESLVGLKRPRVPNPVNPAEDFADNWATTEGRTKKLEENFWRWLTQAKADFELIAHSSDSSFIVEQSMRKFGARLNSGELRKRLGLTAPVVITSPKSHKIADAPARPWKR